MTSITVQELVDEITELVLKSIADRIRKDGFDIDISAVQRTYTGEKMRLDGGMLPAPPEPICGYAPDFRQGEVCQFPASHNDRYEPHQWGPFPPHSSEVGG